MDQQKIRIAAIGDLHVRDPMQDSYSNLFAQISTDAHILLLCGDLTHTGLPSEAEILVSELNSCTIPVVGVLGNHDYEAGKHEEVINIFKKSRLTLLDGDSIVVGDVGIVGTKGFAGGFGDHMLSSFGEEAIKQFVQVAIDESLKLEKALAKLQSKKKIVILHYSPIRQTVIGEDPEILPFLGNSRLEESINRYKADAVFHGHAHRGTHEGKTTTGIPVFNVSFSINKEKYNDKPYKIFEIDVSPKEE